MSLPYYKRFPRDFLEATIGLSFEVKGAFAIVLDLIYMRDGRLPDDARYIAGQLGCSVRKWTAIRAELVAAGKLTAQNGIISNFRADYLTEETRKYQDKQAEIAGKPRKNKPLVQPEPSQAEAEPEPEPKVIRLAAVEAGDDWPDGNAFQHAKLLVIECETARLDLDRQQGLVTSTGRLHQWRQDGATWTYDVLPVVKVIARKQGPPIKSWTYFDGAISQSIADNRRALQIPEASHERPNSPASKRTAREDNFGRSYRAAMALVGS